MFVIYSNEFGVLKSKVFRSLKIRDYPIDRRLQLCY